MPAILLLALIVSAMMKLLRSDPTARMVHLIAPMNGMLSSQITGLPTCEALDLIKIGAVYLRKCNSIEKPKRVVHDTLVMKGDYIRFHPSPRRYPVEMANFADRILAEGDHFVIIDKPFGVPSNPTVDNLKENILEALRASMGYDELMLPHRLDTDTSGILVLAKSKSFAKYFGELLLARKIKKYYRMIIVSEDDSDNSLMPGQLLEHYMLPSSRSPKTFLSSPPDLKSEGPGAGIVCQSKIHTTTPPVTLTRREWVNWATTTPNSGPSGQYFKNGFDDWLGYLNGAERLDARKPFSFRELELMLITGRTHQCRGQIQALGDTLRGVHIAGDNLYTGATSTERPDSYKSSQYLALQACRLTFPLPVAFQSGITFDSTLSTAEGEILSHRSAVTPPKEQTFSDEYHPNAVSKLCRNVHSSSGGAGDGCDELEVELESSWWWPLSHRLLLHTGK